MLRSRTRSWLFLLVVGVLTLGSLSLFYTKHVTVKLLPFDNKSELSVVIDLPEGVVGRGNRRRGAGRCRAWCWRLPEVRSVQTHAGTAAPFNFNGLVRHSYLRAMPEQGDVAINLLPKDERDWPSHAIALDIRDRIAAIAVPPGTSLKVVEPPPGPPVMATLLAEIYGPDAETRRQVGGEVETAFRSVPFIVDIDNSYGEPARRLRATVSTDDAEFFRVEERDVFDTIAILSGGETVGYSHRGDGRQPIPIRIERPKRRPHDGRALPDHADPGQRAAGRPRRGGTGRRGAGGRRARLVPGVPP